MKKVFVWLLLPLLLVACSKNSGDEFVGHWVKVSGQGADLTIEKHGDVFVVQMPNPMIPEQPMKAPAEMKEGKLVMNTGVGDAAFVIDKSTGHLLVPGEELSKASK